MGIATSVKIFIFPDETKLLLLKTNGLYNSDPDGSNQIFIQSGNYYATYIYDEITGFIYFMDQGAGDVWRNTTAFDFSAFTDLGNFFSGFTSGAMIKANNGRIIFGGTSNLRYTDDLFITSTDISLLTGALQFLFYEGGDNIVAITYPTPDYTYYRSTDNGLTWPTQSMPLGLNAVYAGYKF